MTAVDRFIKTEEMNISDFVSNLRKGEFLIPSFQREFILKRNPDIVK